MRRYKKFEWKKISKRLSKILKKHKTPKQCRDRWLNYVNPSLKNEKLSEDELQKLFALQKKLGNKWSKISKEFPEKSENLLKNSFYSTIRRNIRRFNKNKADSEKIRGSIDLLLSIPEIRIILERGSCMQNQELSLENISRETLDLINTMSQPMVIFSEDNDYELNVDRFLNLSGLA